MIVARVPASSANLGPGFDALGMAVSMYAEIGTVEDGSALPPRAHIADDRHPADVAFRTGGGRGAIWVRSSIPMARGLGYSGAVRVGGLVAALAQRHGSDAVARARGEVLPAAAELEGHADNVAASLFGGVVATAAGRAVNVPLALAPAVTAWVPATTTSTDRARAALPPTVSFDDAAFNVGRTALLVAALAAGDVPALRDATADRLHQDLRFAHAPASREALETALDAGAWCGWLSGSGPTIVVLCAPVDAATVADSLAHGGVTKPLTIDHAGATAALRHTGDGAEARTGQPW